MKAITIKLFGLALAAALSGCANPSPETGAAVGGIAGAIVAGPVGLVAGGVAGNVYGREARRR